MMDELELDEEGVIEDGDELELDEEDGIEIPDDVDELENL